MIVDPEIDVGRVLARIDDERGRLPAALVAARRLAGGQRAPMAKALVVTATPKAPLAASRATIDQVIAAPSRSPGFVYSGVMKRARVPRSMAAAISRSILRRWRIISSTRSSSWLASPS